MPTYSYRCTGCAVEFDIAQAFSDQALTTCESCGGSLRKLFSAVGVTFNGSGFYRTDARASSGDKKTTKQTSAASTGSSDSSGSSSPTATSSSQTATTASSSPSTS